MARSAPAPEALRTLRQRGSIALGTVAIVACVGMALASIVSGEPSLVLIGLMLLGAAMGWVLLVRPCVVITLHGIHLDNPIRRTVIPWSQVQDVSARWNLEVYSGDHAYPAWAIASHIERPASQGMLGFGALGRASQQDVAPAPKEGTTVGSASRLLESAMDEWRELAAEGRLEAQTGGTLTRTWQPLDIAALAVPILLVVVGILR